MYTTISSKRSLEDRMSRVLEENLDQINRKSSDNTKIYTISLTY
jgi:hypothetical protein